jgi:hypothetical protein
MRSSAYTHIRKLQAVQSKYLCIVARALGTSVRNKIDKDLKVPVFSDHIRAL